MPTQMRYVIHLMARLSSPQFVEEGGKFHLAEAFFNLFKFEIRCPHCAGNPLKPGFIKDEGGKGGKEGQSRRMWRCQRSNSRAATGTCSRATCTEYISLAQKQLNRTQFTEVLEQVCRQFPPDQEAYAALQGYVSSERSRTPTPPPPTSSQASQALPKKRKADEELPCPNKATRHAQFQTRQAPLTPDRSSLQSTLQSLEFMIEMSKTWQKQYQMLTIFLSSSSPPQPTLASETLSWSSPHLGSQHRFSSDATIPCTYPDEDPLSGPSSAPLSPTPASVDPSSSITEPSSKPLPQSKNKKFVRVHVSGAACYRVKAEEESRQAQDYSNPQAEAIPQQPLPQSKARAFLHAFQNAQQDPQTMGDARRRIRQQARDAKVYPEFQALLSQPKLPFARGQPELKCSGPG